MQSSEGDREGGCGQNDLVVKSPLPLAFVHIPKCSGTAFEYYVLSQGPDFANAWAFTGLGREGQPQTLEQYFKDEANAPFFYGHFFYKDMLRCCPNVFLATFVRDPVKRTVSQYKSWHDEANFHPEDPHYIVATPEEREVLLFSQRASLQEFVCSDNPVILDGALGNQQTLYLSTYPGEDMEGHLQSAKKNLAIFDFFGITEKFAESIKLFRSMAPDFSDYAIGSERENRSRVVVDGLTDEVREIIGRQVQYDQQLYEYACQLFEERVQEWASGTKPRYSRARAIQQHGGGGDAAHQLDAHHKACLARIEDLEVEAGRRQLENTQLRAKVAQLEIAQLQAVEAGRQAVDAQQARAVAAETESSNHRAHIAHLEAAYIELSHVYHQIVESRSWRLMAALQSIWLRLKFK